MEVSNSQTGSHPPTTRGNGLLVINQLLTLGATWFIANALIRHAHEVVTAKGIEPPAVSILYFETLGQKGIIAIVAVTAAIVVGNYFLLRKAIAGWISSAVYFVALLF